MFYNEKIKNWFIILKTKMPINFKLFQNLPLHESLLLILKISLTSQVVSVGLGVALSKISIYWMTCIDFS